MESDPVLSALPESGHQRGDSRFHARPPLTWALGLAGALALLFVRSPETLLHPAFAAEDGQTLYIATYFGSPLSTIFTPLAGYLQLIARVAAYVERLVPVAQAPLLAALLSLLVVASMAVYIASDRMVATIPSRRLRFLLAVTFLALPASQEVFGSVHDLQWYLAIWLLLAVLASPARSRWAAWSERTALGAVSLTGPFSIIMAPLFIVRAARERDRDSTIAALIVSGGGIVQLLVTLFDKGRVTQGPYDPIHWIYIISTRMLMQPVLGIGTLLSLEAISWPFYASVLGVLSLAIFVVAAMSRLPRWPVLAGLYAGGAIAVLGVFSNNITPGGTLLNPWEGLRYFFVLGAVIAAALVSGALIRGPDRLRRGLAVAGALLLMTGIVSDFYVSRAPGVDWSVASACIGGDAPCVVHLEQGPGPWDIYWPGKNGVYNPYPTWPK